MNIGSPRFAIVAVSIATLALAACGVPPARKAPSDLRRITVDDVHVEVGVGSPIPVDVFVSGSWPDLCAQLARVEQEFDGSDITITLLATAEDPDCPPDVVGIPFGIAIPLNVVQLPAGAYTVTANGVETSFEWPVS